MILAVLSYNTSQILSPFEMNRPGTGALDCLVRFGAIKMRMSLSCRMHKVPYLTYWWSYETVVDNSEFTGHIDIGAIRRIWAFWYARHDSLFVVPSRL